MDDVEADRMVSVQNAVEEAGDRLSDALLKRGLDVPQNIQDIAAETLGVKSWSP